jgi:hypothetical protein
MASENGVEFSVDLESDTTAEAATVYGFGHDGFFPLAKDDKFFVSHAERTLE